MYTVNIGERIYFSCEDYLIKRADKSMIALVRGKWKTYGLEVTDRIVIKNDQGVQVLSIAIL